MRTVAILAAALALPLGLPFAAGVLSDTAGQPQADATAAGAGDLLATGAFVGSDDGVGGTVTLVGTPNGVLLAAQVDGLAPGEHGFHIHETGRCDPPGFDSAGGHWAMAGEEHGFGVEAGPHAGDLPNIFVNNDGFATVHLFLSAQTPSGVAAAMIDDDGAALIVHEEADTYLEEAAAEGRVACAVLEPAGG